MNGPAWRPRLQKLEIYEGIFNLNRAFHATLLSLERLENLGFFRSEYLNAFKVELEHTRATTNDELIETLREYEQDTLLPVPKAPKGPYYYPICRKKRKWTADHFFGGICRWWLKPCG